MSDISKIVEEKILKALEICSMCTGCDGCPYEENFDCAEIVLLNSFEFIRKYKKENERLQNALSRAEECIDEIEDALQRGTGNDRAMAAVEKYNGFCASEINDEQ